MGRMKKRKPVEIPPNLLERLCRGEEQAYLELFDLFSKRVYSLVFRMVRDASLAEDLTQEVFLKVFKRIGTLKDPSKLSAWMMQIAHNTCLDWLKKKRPETLLTDFCDPAAAGWIASMARDNPGSSPEEILLKMESERLDSLIGLLPVKYREILLLRYVHGYSYKEIASILDIPVSSVKFRKHYALKMLHERLKNRRGPE